MLIIDRHRPTDDAAVEQLLERAFGPGRHMKTAQRLRDGRRPADGLALVMRDDAAPWGERIAGTLTFWNVSAGPGVPALMLGPLAVDPDYQSQGIGKVLVRRGLDQARRLGHAAVILVGDAPYYGRFGFTRDLTRDLMMPGPVDEARFLGLELQAGGLARAAGLVRPTGVPVDAALATAA